MVTRKPVAAPLDTSNVGRKADPPYPTSPEDKNKTPATSSSVYSPDLSKSPAFDLTDMQEAQSRQRRNSDVSSHGTWDTDDEDKDEEDYVEVPRPLRITPSKQNLSEPAKVEPKDEIPAILRPGPSKALHPQDAAAQALANPWVNEPSQHPAQVNAEPQSNNPYHKGKAAVLPASLTPGAAAAAATPSPPPMAPPIPQQAPPVELPTVRTPAEELAQLSLDHAPPRPNKVPAVPVPSPSAIPANPAQPAINTEQPLQQPAEQSFVPPTPQQKWGEQHYPSPPGPPPSSSSNLIDHPPPPSMPASVAASTNTSAHATQLSNNQRSEHYQIKHINWRNDWSTRGGDTVRQSPILTQNANGPCPLLALVNALVLTTPPDAHTALIETLRTREQISLGLLLDAVFDELTSNRLASSTNKELPDVSELYAFLLALHTGMNVNPRFVPSKTPDPSAEHSWQENAGEFEQTREMRLYATFKVRLIHGWLPQPGSDAEQAFARNAPTFEDAQNIQFAGLELDHKLQNGGLSPTEQTLLQDVQTIQHFLNTWPTQLTERGLDAISKSIYPGQFAILFRNDHFSTIYKEPKHGALMTLVTDAGYSSHDEIVWESLVDVNGAASEMFSGDFRVVSHDQDARLNQSSSAGGQDGWTTVPPRRNNQHEHVTTASRPSNSEIAPPLPGPRPPTLANTVGNNDGPPAHQRSKSEQEDHDLALALQLQEEEEAQQRQTEDRRRREQQLSEQFLSSDADARPNIPPRRGGSRMSTSVRPGVNRPGDGTFNPDAPPTYEQSASDRPYREAGSTARPQQSSTLSMYDELRRREEQQSAYAQNTANSPTGNPAQYHGRRQSYGRGRRPQHAATTQDAEERCALM